MAYRKHRHFFRLQNRHHHPDGYIFICNRCARENLVAHKFIRFNSFWGN